MRITMLCLFTQGLGLGFLGVLALRETLLAQASGAVFLTAAVGALVAVLPGPGLTLRGGLGPFGRLFLLVCGVAACLGLLAAAGLHSFQRSPTPAFCLSVAVGGSLRLALGLLLRMLPLRGARAVFGLAGVSFGLGGCMGHLLALTALSLSSASLLLGCAAVVPALLAVCAHRTGRLHSGLAGAAASALPPTTVPGARNRLFAASLVLQAIAGSLASVWLMGYLARSRDSAGSHGTTILAMFWLALAGGWMLSGRIPGPLDRWQVLALPTLPTVAGGVVLALAPMSAALAAGAALLGGGLGLACALTLCMGQRPTVLASCRWAVSSLRFSPPVALAACWLVGGLVGILGIDAVVWAVLACSLGALAALILLILDYRVTGAQAVL